MSAPSARLRELIDAYASGVATAEQVQRLTDLLRQDPAARDQFLRDLDLHACLVTDESLWLRPVTGANSAAPVTVAPRAVSPWRRVAPYLALAAAVLLVLSLWSLLPPRGPALPVPPTAAGAAPAEYIATLVHSQSAGLPLVDGQRLLPGLVRLTQGAVELCFDSGARLLVAGPAELELQSTGSARLQRGQAAVHVPPEAAGFVLLTPGAQIVDLGTEFGARVEAGGVTEVHTFVGQVACRLPGEGATALPRTLAAGQALRIDPKGTVAAMPADAAVFARRLPPGPAVAPPQGAGLLAEERFEYAVGDLRHGDPRADGGRGWRGPWTRAWPTAELPLGIDPAASLPPPPGLPPAIGGSLHLQPDPHQPPPPVAHVRRLAHPIDLGQDGLVYFSVLVRRNRAAGDKAAWAHVVLSPAHSLSDRLGALILGNDQLVACNGGRNGSVALALAPGQTHLLVGKLITGRTAPEQVLLLAYGPSERIPAADPGQWLIASPPAAHDAVLSALHLFTGPTGDFTFDDIRLGTSWQAVVPPLARAQEQP